MIVSENKNGKIYFEEIEIVMFIEEQIKLIPGVLFYRGRNLFKSLREILNLTTGKVAVSQVSVGEVFIELKICLNKEINYKFVEEEIYTLLSYSLQKKYGLTINNLEIVIQDLV